MKKFELTDEFIEHPSGIKLYRIRALRNFRNVNKGDLGGYLETESNLAHQGDCWVAGQAQVFGNAQVSGNAQVFGNAQVSGKAQVFGDARVSGKAQVFGDACITENALVLGEACVMGNAYVTSNAKVYGNARVYDNAKVFGNAKVYGNTDVYRHAQVYGYAQVSGYAEVSGNAQVLGDAWVSAYARVDGDAFIKDKTDVFSVSRVGSENGTLTVFPGKNGLLVTRGCFIGTVDEFLAKSKEVHDEVTHREYQLLIDVAKSRIQNPFYLRKRD